MLSILMTITLFLGGNTTGESYSVAVAWRHLAGNFTKQARYSEALDALDNASKLVARDKLTDPGLNAQILNNLGFIYYNQNKTDKAEKLFIQAADLQFTARDPLDVDQWQVVNNLGRVYESTRRYAKAEETYLRALELAELRCGNAHPNLTVVLDNLGLLYLRIGRYDQAEAQFQRSLAIVNRSTMIFDSLLLMRTFYGLGETYRRQHDSHRAEPILARAAEIARRRSKVTEMPEVLSVLNSYIAVLQDLSHSEEARRFETEAQRIRATMAYTVPVGNLK
jgi:tetratricopeptide (TPR) repeat protein